MKSIAELQGNFISIEMISCQDPSWVLNILSYTSFSIKTVYLNISRILMRHALV
jgi:hypothetical protein